MHSGKRGKINDSCRFQRFSGHAVLCKTALGQVEGEKAMQPQRQPVMQQVPVVPTQPVAPVAPVQPTMPMTSVQPTAPVISTQPAVPTAPAQSVTPVTPNTGYSTDHIRYYTPDDLARAAFALMDSGRQQELIGLLQQFGVNAIPELKPEQFGAFATALRGMGAQI